MSDISDATAAGLLLFLDWTIERGELNPVTARSIRTACRRVLDGEDAPEAIELRDADVEGMIRRFVNRRRADFKEDSLQSYASRFRQAVAMYLTYLDGGVWRPTRSRRPAVNEKSSTGRAPRPSASPGHVPSEHRGAHSSHGPAMITYPLPVRSGVRGQLSVPEDLTAAEARRVANIVAALAVTDSDGEEKP